jgi:hypothetical protein
MLTILGSDIRPELKQALRIIEEAMCALASHGLVPPADDLPEWNHDDPQFGELRLAWRKFFIGQE